MTVFHTGTHSHSTHPQHHPGLRYNRTAPLLHRLWSSPYRSRFGLRWFFTWLYAAIPIAHTAGADPHNGTRAGATPGTTPPAHPSPITGCGCFSYIEVYIINVLFLDYNRRVGLHAIHVSNTFARSLSPHLHVRRVHIHPLLLTYILTDILICIQT